MVVAKLRLINYLNFMIKLIKLYFLKFDKLSIFIKNSSYDPFSFDVEPEFVLKMDPDPAHEYFAIFYFLNKFPKLSFLVSLILFMFYT